MTQKVLKVGDSAAVTIPKRSLEELGIKVGDKISVEVDKKHGSVFIRRFQEISKADKTIAKLTLDFINRYRMDIEALAKK